MPKTASPISPFDYLDYRKFLKDWYEYQKKNTRGFSFRAFSSKAGFGSPNFLKRIIEGDRNLTAESLKQVVRGLGLNKQETEFFEKLVLFTQAESHEEKNKHYGQLLKSQKFNQLKPMERDQYELCSTWYHPIIRELIVSPAFDGTFEWLGSHVRPSITPGHAQKSVELLERLNFIKKIGENRWEQSDPLVSTGPEAMSVTSMNYHKCVLDLVKYQLPRTHPLERDVSVLTLGVKKGKLPQLKKKIQDFRREILEMVSDDTEPDDVILLATQLLPVSQRRKQAKKSENS